MSAIDILIAVTQPDLVADGVVAAVRERGDMRLACERVLATAEVEPILSVMDGARPCAIVLVGNCASGGSDSMRWLRDHPAIVVVRVALTDDTVHFDAGGVGLDTLLATTCELARRQDELPRRRVARVLMRSGVQQRPRPLLDAALAWIHATLGAAVAQQCGSADDIPGLSVSAATVQRLLAGGPCAAAPQPGHEAAHGAAALAEALAGADPAAEPLAALYHYLGLDLLEWKLLLLALAPECDPRYQKCVGFLLDDMGRRSGTLTLFAAMLGEPAAVRRRLAHSGQLARWRLFDGAALPGPHDPLQLDPWIVEWVFGGADALAADPRLRRVLRATPWPGASLLRGAAELDQATALLDRLDPDAPCSWLVLGGADPAGWRALLELGAGARARGLLRLELSRMPADPLEAEEAALRAARCALLARALLVLDADGDGHDAPGEQRQAALAALGAAPQPAAIVTTGTDAVFRALGEQDLELIDAGEAGPLARGAVAQAAAAQAGLELDGAAAAALGHAFPLRIDGMARASRLARAGAGAGDSAALIRANLLAACRSTASQRLSRLAHRITPQFRLADVVLPEDRASQLHEIVSNVRLAPKVFGEWRFGERVPYGRGVAVLFFGPSGTGKTMAAQAVAHELGIDIFALDLSRVVSKYIGETERNIDAVFTDASHSGAAVLIDEADALLGKRSDVKDAHDRYANIEVAYLLQRMESFEGLAILTSNIRHNIDQAFVRRLRFMVEFPRPDARARAAIWRLCLPDGSHALGEREIQLLARQAELTGGHIRQIALRAAFAAAAAGVPIGIPQVQHAMNAELTKLGLPSIDLRLMERAA